MFVFYFETVLICANYFKCDIKFKFSSLQDGHTKDKGEFNTTTVSQKRKRNILKKPRMTLSSLKKIKNATRKPIQLRL